MSRSRRPIRVGPAPSGGASRDLLFEIGVEELPAGYVPPALEQLERGAAAMLDELRLEHGAIRALGTPRRLALMVEAVAARQPDRSVEVVGPAVRAAFDPEGKPTRALLGFCQAKNVNLSDVRRVAAPKGEYVAATVHIAGVSAVAALPVPLAMLAGSLTFPKTMRWLADDTRFARPVRWLVALLGDEVFPVPAFGLHTGRHSYGHRFLAPGPDEIRSASAYVESLRAASVLVDHHERERRLVEDIEAKARKAGGRIVADPELVEINNFMVEWPTAYAGRFDAHYLDLRAR